MSRFLMSLAMLALISTTLAPHLARGDDDDDKAKSSSIWMKQKLVASQNILAGLTKEDYEAIEKNAQSMLVVGYLEKWVRADTPGIPEADERLRIREQGTRRWRLAKRTWTGQCSHTFS